MGIIIYYGSIKYAICFMEFTKIKYLKEILQFYIQNILVNSQVRPQPSLACKKLFPKVWIVLDSSSFWPCEVTRFQLFFQLPLASLNKHRDDTEECSYSGLGFMQLVDLGCNSRDYFYLETIDTVLGFHGHGRIFMGQIT